MLVSLVLSFGAGQNSRDEGVECGCQGPGKGAEKKAKDLCAVSKYSLAAPLLHVKPLFTAIAGALN